METETADDVVDLIKPTTEADLLKDKPIMMLFIRLIGNVHKQNMMLTNAQIEDLLEKEFNIDTNTLHEIEMDIYLSVMKKFLKDWPQWDKFDTAINKLKIKKDQDGIQKMLVEKYHDLRSYLSIMLETARPKAMELKVELMKASEPPEVEQKSPEEDLSDVVLEICCSRSQLNHLIYRHPHPEHGLSIFNPIETGPSKICLDTPDYDAILNWWNVNVVFKVNNFHFVRSTAHDVKHTLVNKKLSVKEKQSKLKTGYQVKNAAPGRAQETITKSKFVSILRKIYYNVSSDYKPFLEVLYSTIEKDLVGLPSEFNDTILYRKYYCRYPYVRYLRTEVPEAKHVEEAMKYDLCLREVISPMYQLRVLKVEPIGKTSTTVDVRNIYLECSLCSSKFTGFEDLREHILEEHMNEPDWSCTKCKQSFTMVNLAKNRWVHECRPAK